MKRFTAMILCMMMVLSLCACNIQSDTNNSTPVWTEPPVVTLPDGSVVYSEEAFVEYPQTGEYKETALLTNVPGQRLPLLLDMRKDGTIDYLFADVENSIEEVSFAGNQVIELGGAFTCAPAVKKVTLPEGLPSINSMDFWMCAALETVIIPESVTVIDDYAF